MIYKTEFRAMGSHVTALLETDEDHADVLRQVPGWFQEWERVLSRFWLDSELNELNRRKGESVAVSSTLFDVLTLSVRAWQESEGLVTPEILDAIEAWGYDRSFAELPANRSLQVLTAPVQTHLDTILLDSKLRRVKLPAGLRLDLGGVAKGWAAQQAMLRLGVHGAALVNAGGDVAISRALDNGDAWPVSVLDPFHPNVNLALLQVTCGGVATSGKDFHNWLVNGLQQHHIIDPRSGVPAQTDLLTATVLAPTVMQAETAAKTAFILGSRAGMEWLQDRPQLSGILIAEDGSFLQTENLNRPVWRCE
jgi:thiamine biosynthesis lipoprotein